MEEVKAVTDENTLKVIPTLLITHYSKQISNVWCFGLNTALRISDLLSIKFTDISGDRLKIIEGKTKKVADIALNHKALEIIEEIQKEFPNDTYLFQSHGKNMTGKTKPLTRQSISQALKEVGKMVGVDLGTHSMRKTRGYHLYEKTNDIARVSKMLRHSSTGVTLRYIGITQQDIDRDFTSLVL
jgi:integrase